MDDPGYLTMSAKELNRLKVLNRVLDRRLTQAQAAEQLGDYEALREMGGWSSWQAIAHYVAAGQEQRRRIAERF